MPEYLHPGVYVEEVANGGHDIEGVATTTAAFIGVAERGPLRPCLVTSLSEYGRHFGGTDVDGFLPHAARGFFENGGGRLFVCRMTGGDTTVAGIDLGGWPFRAVGPGDWGRRVWLTVGPGSTRRADGSPVGFRVRVAYFAPGREIYDPFSAANETRLPRPQYLEDFDDVPVAGFSPRHIGSVLIDVACDDESAGAPAAFAGLLGATSPGDADTMPQGLAALQDPACDDVSLVYAPAADEALQRAIVAFCERQPKRFAVLDVARGADLVALHPRTSIADSAFGAMYAPWLWIADATGARILVPPGGHVAGMIVRVDRERGAHKAPANEALAGVLGLEAAIDDRLQQELNPRGLNAIREFPGSGVRVWGARTLSSDAQWKYVNVRRWFIFLELSLVLGTRWAVFEQNDAMLWAKVRSQLETFLRGQWLAGALLGDREERAYYVRCGPETMTQADIDEGRLVVEVGCAPLRPAEFVVLRFEHHMART